MGYPSTTTKSLTTRRLPAVQAASCLLGECIPQRSIHLLRVLESDSTKEFCFSVDETVLKAAKRILELPELLDWQNEALFIPADRGGWGSRKLEQRRHAATTTGTTASSTPEGTERCGPEGVASRGPDQRERWMPLLPASMSKPSTHSDEHPST